MNPKSKIPEPMKKPILLYLTTLALTALCGGAAAGQAAAQSAPDMSKYILTPKPADTPRINGARVFGVRPGSEFLYTIAATGVRPMTFSAEGLPKGLKLDPETGRITGRVTAPGEYTVHLKAANASGSCERNLKIVVGDEIALTPPMGWNSWNCWARDAPQWMRYSNCWRTTGDIRDTWESISSIGFSQDRWLPFNRPGHWADPDMLVIGMVGWGPKLHYTQLTADEQYTHISLWSLLAAPLLIGCDMAQMDDYTRSLLTNDEVIDVNQDPLGLQAVPVWQQGDQVIYAKHLEDGSMAVGLFNRGWQTVKMNFTLRMLGLRGRQTVRDLWRQKDLTECTDKFETAVAPHGVVLVRVYPGNSREQATGK